MSSLKDHLLHTITTKGLISIDEFMTITLTSKEESYYINNLPLGRNGDFTTAPEISQIFGEVIAIWIMLAWEKLGSPAQFNLIELGPGRGILMRDILKSTKKFLPFQNAINQISFVECNKRLINYQATLLQDISKKIIWFESFFQIQSQLPSIIIANEFFDALPIKQYIKKSKGWHEIMVGSEVNQEIKFVERFLTDNESHFLNIDYSYLKEGDIVETSYESLKLLQHIIEKFQSFKGAALIIDYGYNRKLSTKTNYISSLQAVKDHNYHPVLDDIGQADLSIMVDFEKLISVLENNNCKNFNYYSQREFLLNHGINLRFKRLINLLDSSKQEDLLFAYERLINPEQMGTIYKALEYFHF